MYTERKGQTVTKLSIVVPCFNEEEALPLFYDACEKAVKTLGCDWEYWLVDDGSSDHTIAVMRSLHDRDEHVHYLSFSRNFGKEAAIYAGLSASEGDYTVIMDADLQDPPALLAEMYKAVTEEGYDCCGARRTTRAGEPKIRSWFARRFYHLMRRISDTEIVDGARDFRMMNRKMTDAVVADQEYNRFSKGIFSWVGFKTKWLSYENVERAAGKTKWSFGKLFKYAVDGIVAYSTAPLMFVAMLGLIFALAAVAVLLFVVIRALLYGDPVKGWPSMVSFILFFGGLELLCMGILAVYVSKIYLETKKRQIYIIREKK